MKKHLSILISWCKHRHYNMLKQKRLTPIEVPDRAAARKYYIINNVGTRGFFSNYLFVLGHMIYASKKHMIPVVDMEHYKTLYNEETLCCGTMNAWEYYFVPMCSLEQAYNSGCAYLGDRYYSEYLPRYIGRLAWWPSAKDAKKFLRYIEQYMQVKPEIVEMVDRIIVEKQLDAGVLGVHIRGTDMKNSTGHPHPPTIAEYTRHIETFIKKYDVKKILLCSDEADIIQEFSRKYGDMIVTTDSYRSTDGATAVHTSGSYVRENHRYLLGLEVLVDALLLSRCDYLISGKSNVPLAAILMNGGKYKNRELIG